MIAKNLNSTFCQFNVASGSVLACAYERCCRLYDFEQKAVLQGIIAGLRVIAKAAPDSKSDSSWTFLVTVT